MARVDLFEFSDLLHYARKLGYDWNQAHDILVKDGVCPMYECNKRELYLGEGPAYGWTEDSCKIVDGFLKENEIEMCVLVND
jgi:hypothetical protein